MRRLLTDRGFTLTELMVVVSIMGIMMGIGYSGYTSWREREQVRGAATELAGYLREARVLAMEKHLAHWVIFNNNTYTVVRDTNDDGNYVAADDTIIHTVDLAQEYKGVSISYLNSANPNYRITYGFKGSPTSITSGDATSTLGGSVTFTNAGLNSRVTTTYTLTITPLGQITVQ